MLALFGGEFAGHRKGLGILGGEMLILSTKLRVAAPFSKAIAKGCIPEIEGMQPFFLFMR